MSSGESCMSPQKEATPLRISLRNPEDIETETIMTRKEMAMQIIAILPLKRRRPAMNPETFIYFLLRASRRAWAWRRSASLAAFLTRAGRYFFSSLTFLSLRAMSTQFLIAV